MIQISYLGVQFPPLNIKKYFFFPIFFPFLLFQYCSIFGDTYIDRVWWHSNDNICDITISCKRWGPLKHTAHVVIITSEVIFTSRVVIIYWVIIIRNYCWYYEMVAGKLAKNQTWSSGIGFLSLLTRGSSCVRMLMQVFFLVFLSAC